MPPESPSSPENFDQIFKSPDIDPSQYKSPSIPLTTYEGPIEEEIKIPKEEKELLISLASWENNPPFQQIGRSCEIARQEVLQIDDINIFGYKLKGIGNCSRLDQNNPHSSYIIEPPSTQTYKSNISQNFGPKQHPIQQRINKVASKIIHMGIAEDGSFYPVPDPDKPLGGLSPGRGQNEFEIAARLNQAGINSCGPISWGVYPQLTWQNEPMEFVILSLPTDNPHRMSAYFEPEMNNSGIRTSSAMKEVISQEYDYYPESKIDNLAFKTANKMGASIGRSLKKAHLEAEIARFAGHTGNFQYTPGGREAIIHDYDSSIFLENIHPEARAITLIRDLESAMFGMFHSFGHSHLFYLNQGNEKAFQKNNPVIALLKGYFEEDLESLTEIWDKTVSKINNSQLNSIKLRGEHPTIERQQAWLIDFNKNFTQLFIQEIHKLYLKSNLNNIHPSPFTEETLSENLLKFKESSRNSQKKAIAQEFQNDSPEIKRMLRMQGLI